MEKFEPKQFGKYLLLEKLAVGGMAEIYKAKTYGVDGFEKELAIKRILPHCAADKDFITMLTDEAKLSVMLSHANIVQVYDLGKVGDDYYISMEFIHGPNLRDIMYKCREEKIPIAVEIAVFIISEICKGLDYAHRKTDARNKPLNIVHRDISPQNILISYEGEVKIVDFGIAKAAMNISHTMAGILKGKIAYMSPEQAMGKAVDYRTDIFSAGILFYEMLTGTKLYTGESQFEVLKKIRTTKVTADKLPESVPEPLRPMLAKALAFDVEDRFQNAGDLQIELTKYLYSKHSDFSPRRLASFIRDTLRDVVAHEQEIRAREAAMEGQTTSMNIAEGAKQTEIVHREMPPAVRAGPPRPKRGRERLAETLVAPTRGAGAEAEVPTESRTFRRRSFRRMAALAAVAVAAAGIYAAFHYAPALRFWEKPPAPGELGSARIESEPEGAQIFLDGNDTGKRTPATLEELAVGETYRIKLTKEDFGPAEKEINIASAERLDVKLTLEALAGTINIITEPPGAAIMLNGKLTGLTTPATLEKLPLNADQRITISKPDFEDFEQVVNLSSARPQRISTRLNPLKVQLGKLVITSTPSGASILLDGNDSGRTTPATIANLDPKAYRVTMKLDGYKNWVESFDVKAESSVTVDANLIKEEVAPPEARTGSLRITSDPPGAGILLDGRTTGKATPATLADLKIGATYSIRLDKDGYKRSYLKKTMRKESETLYAELAVERTTERPPEPPPTPEPEPPIDYGPGAKPGRIKLASTPSGADVFINAEHRGKTPLTVKVPAGSVHVMVNKDGYVRYSKRIEVRPGQSVNLATIEMGSLYGEVVLTTQPPRAQVVFDGQTIPARTPVTVRKVRTDSQHTVTVQLSGYKPWTKTFNMQGKNRMVFNIALESQ